MPVTIRLQGGQHLERALQRLSERVKRAAAVDVGFMGEDSAYPDGTPTALVAAINEYGAPSRGQPPRPFFRRAIKANRSKWPRNLEASLKKYDYDAEAALEEMGNEIEGEIKESINRFTSPGLAESTKRRKGFDKPLIDTSHMINSTTHVVRRTRKGEG